jgi:hypothetical protein
MSGFAIARRVKRDPSTVTSKPGKRVKHVHPDGMVTHLWAHKSQDSARNPRGNIFFQGDTIYSYGHHFPIAKHVTRKGKSAVLLTTRDYSATTRGHKWGVESACSHLPTFHVDNIESREPRKQFEEYRARYLELARKYVKSRQNKPWVLQELQKVVKEANAFSAFFALRVRLTLPAESDMAAECKAIEKKEREAKKREAAKRERQAAEQLQKWVNGETDYPTHSMSNGQPIRLRIKGDELQTSHGARVPLAHAVKAFRIIKGLRDKGQAYERNGHTIHLGPFALDAVDTQGNVRAGCHNVAWEEIARVATIAGVN